MSVKAISITITPQQQRQKQWQQILKRAAVFMTTPINKQKSQ